MNNIVFARPRHEYGSYRDFWHLVDLAGFRVQYINEIDWSQGHVTVIGIPKTPDWKQIPDRHNARLIWWNIERCVNADDVWDMSNPRVPRCVDEVWTSDRSIATRFNWKYVFLGGHSAFASGKMPSKRYDIITLMAPLPRRTDLFNELKRFNVADTGDLWGEERDLRLRQSRLMLMCHQDDQPICEPPRMMIGGCYALPMLCEESTDSGYWVAFKHYVPAKFGDLIGSAQFLLNARPDYLEGFGRAAWRLVTIEHPFRETVEAAL